MAALDKRSDCLRLDRQLQHADLQVAEEQQRVRTRRIDQALDPRIARGFDELVASFGTHGNWYASTAGLTARAKCSGRRRFLCLRSLRVRASHSRNTCMDLIVSISTSP